MIKKPCLSICRSSLIAIAISQLFSAPCWAETDAERIAKLEKMLAQSMAKVDQLSARVEELEKSRATASAPSAPASPQSAAAQASTAAQNERIDAIERTVAQMNDASVKNTGASDGLPIHGFMDVGYQASQAPATDGRKKGFALGNFDLYMTPEFGDRVKGLVELNFEWEDGSYLSTDTERMQLGYTVSDQLTLWLGRFHTPFGYWNTAFHHGAQIQTSITRPRFLAFEDEGGMMPSHTVGLWASGQARLGDGRLAYDAYYGNGQRILAGSLDFNAVRSNNTYPMVGGNLSYRFGGGLDGLVLGTHAFTEKVGSYADAADSLPAAFLGASKVNMAGAYAFYDGNDWEIISEYYHFGDDDVSGSSGRHNSWAGFVQVGKMLATNVTPYVRIEKADLDQSDTYFGTQTDGRSYRRSVLGVRYDLNAKSALKLEMRHTDDDALGTFNELQLQAATRF